jgi:SAM-dependent methyltransferase
MQFLIDFVRKHSIVACEETALKIAASLGNVEHANIGGGPSARWPRSSNIDPMHDPDLDFNTKPIPFESGQFPLVICEQVIEHLHNTTFFLSELNRILRPGGHLLLSTENLSSIPNICALLLGMAPFSTQAICGEMIGGIKKLAVTPDCKFPTNHPCFSGVRGHVRVMTNGQIKILLQKAGFRIQKHYRFGFNHYVLFHCVKNP